MKGEERRRPRGQKKKGRSERRPIIPPSSAANYPGEAQSGWRGTEDRGPSTRRDDFSNAPAEARSWPADADLSTARHQPNHLRRPPPSHRHDIPAGATKSRPPDRVIARSAAARACGSGVGLVRRHDNTTEGAPTVARLGCTSASSGRGGGARGPSQTKAGMPLIRSTA